MNALQCYRQPGSGNWGFNCYRGLEILDKWNKIPEETDILLTHGPPCGRCQTRSFNPLPHNKVLDWSKLKAYADANLNMEILDIVVVQQRVKKNFWKWRNSWLQASSPFFRMYSDL